MSEKQIFAFYHFTLTGEYMQYNNAALEILLHCIYKNSVSLAGYPLQDF